MSQRRDDVSAKLGSLLLKGWKMLADSCAKCGNVLMQDKKGVVICVNCNEDDQVAQSPAIVMEVNPGLIHQLAEHGYNQSQVSSNNKEALPEAACYAEGVLLREIKNVALYLEKTRLRLDGDDDSETLKERKIYLEHIRQCAETIKSLQGIRRM